MGGRLSALFLLALALMKTLLLRLAQARPLEQFKEHYGDEGIQRVDADEAQVLAQASGCTSCGLCDRGEGERVRQSRFGYRGLMAFAQSGLRSLPDFDATARTIQEVPDEAFRAGEKACPERVPLVALAQLVRGHAERGSKRRAA